MVKSKINVQHRITDGEIDLSMSDLDDVPVREIATIRKVYALDLSNNNLKLLPKTFPTLTHITKLDLSKNELMELPDNFGDLIKLRYLDLYHNRLQHLPLSFSKLVDLKWLDLKDNPLVPTVAKVAGQCLDAKECQTCARNIVNFFVQLQKQVDSELKSRQEERQLMEANQLKKQNDKKLKKKAKSKQKQVKTVTDSVNAEKTVKEPKIATENKENTKKSCLILSFLNSTFISVVFIAPILFVLTSINVKSVNFAKEYAVNAYSKAMTLLPPNLHEHGIIFGNFIENFHEKTGNYTNNLINIIATNEDFRYFYNIIINYVDKIANNIKEIYNNFVQ